MTRAESIRPVSPDGEAMKTVLITNGNLLSLLSLGWFLRRHHEDLAAVVITTRLPSQRSNVLGVLSMLWHSGWRYTHFKLVTNVLLPRLLRRHGLPASVPEYLWGLGSEAPIFEADDVNRPEIVERIRGFAPDILLSFSATSRFGDSLLEVPSRAALNLHYALLPEYAGLSPYFWYLRNRERECGVTLHQITARLDAGPVIDQRHFPMHGIRTVLGVLRHQMARISPTLLHFYAGDTNEAQAAPQDLSRRRYFRHPTRADVRALYAAGFRFYDHADLHAIETQVRALAGRSLEAAEAGIPLRWPRPFVTPRALARDRDTGRQTRPHAPVH